MTANDRVTRALKRADNPDALLESAFAAAASQVDIKEGIETLRGFKGIGEKAALDILGKIALAVVRG